MTATITPTPIRTPEGDLSRGRLTRFQLGAIVVGAIVLGALTWIPTGAVNWARWVIVALIVYIGGTYAASRLVEGTRKATDRLMAALITSAFLVVLLPLISVVWTVVERGSARFDWMFFTDTMRLTPEQLAGQNEGVAAGGAYHAIVGTLIVTGIATAFSVPFGLFTAIYLVEYGRGRLARAITAMVDVMTGIPSIVAGLFAYALFVIFFGPGTRTGLAGGVALTVLMTPVVVRSAEEMLRLVPNELREASYALGVPKWKTIVKVVIPTAVAGILTGITLAIARVIGETAPLLVTVGLAQDTNYNPIDGRMTTLPVYTYYQYVQPGIPVEAGQNRAWAAALVLVVMVAVLFSIARLLATILKPKGLR
jgi:phosphate transport system permease protein